jgi:hypothetical protein
LPRAASLTLIFLAALAAFFVWRAGEDKVYTLETPEFGASITIPVYETAETPDSTAAGMRIGSFEPPERVPEYGILEERLVDTEDARAVRILVNTRARGEADYVLISRDLKARYADYDAISAEFTDTEDLLDYNGGALIFNTPRGATYMGFIYGPPNTEGYYVRAAD